jgi:hypothetical protein
MIGGSERGNQGEGEMGRNKEIGKERNRGGKKGHRIRKGLEVGQGEGQLKVRGEK